MINICRDINACTRPDFSWRLVVYHLFPFPRDNINDLFRAGMIVPCMPFPLGQLGDAETEPLGFSNRRLAEEMDFSPVKFQTINVLGVVITPDPSFCIIGGFKGVLFLLYSGTLVYWNVFISTRMPWIVFPEALKTRPAGCGAMFTTKHP
jgi:hypothetical protein